MPTQFRIATLADTDALLDLIHAAYRGDSSRRGWTHEADLLDGQRTDAEEIQKKISDPNCLLYLVESPDGLIACTCLEKKSESTCYVGMVTVRPDLQAAGLGRALLDQAEVYAREHFGSRELEMTVIDSRAELIAWYERRGYRRTGETRPFPMQDPRAGIPLVDRLGFVVLKKEISDSHRG